MSLLFLIDVFVVVAGIYYTGKAVAYSEFAHQLERAAQIVKEANEELDKVWLKYHE